MSSATSRVSPRSAVLSLAVMIGIGLAPGLAQAQSETCRPPAQSGEGQAKSNQDGQTLSQTLDSCNGVLTPPQTGDGGLVEPAPETGKTPVITPGTLPPGSNPSNNPG